MPTLYLTISISVGEGLLETCLQMDSLRLLAANSFFLSIHRIQNWTFYMKTRKSNKAQIWHAL